MKIVTKALLTTVISGTLCTVAAAQQITWTVGYVNANGSSYVATLLNVPDRISKATNGRLKIELYDTLVPGPNQPAAVRDGTLDGSFAVSPWLSAEAPFLNVGMLPGLLTDVAQYQKMLDPFLREEMATVWMQRYNAHQLATGIFELQCVISKTPLLTVKDFAGKKIRVHNNSAGDLMRQVGAAPTAVPFGEIVPALQRGVVDVVMTSVGTANGFGFADVAKHMSIWSIGAITSWSFVVSDSVWKKLPDDLKKIVTAEFRKIEDEHFAEHQSFNEQNIQKLRDSGMEVTFVKQEELDKIFSPENTKPVFDAWYALNERSGTDGRQLVKRIEEFKANNK